jgi:16S rRNA (uracil1498-N3)-methyltransferase
MSATPRLFVSFDLAAGASNPATPEAAHYLGRVLRLAAGDEVRLFNGRDGEWLARLAGAERGGVTLEVAERLRRQAAALDLTLLFAPLKKARTDFVVEKATELGVRAIAPVLTVRCEAQSVRTDRFGRIAVEAAEQTERLDVPVILRPQALWDALAGWRKEVPLVFCDEAGGDAGAPWGGASDRAAPLLDVLDELARSGCAGRGGVLIGPEGGFAPAERARLRSLAFVRPATLGPRILRAETAAVAALALWQARLGDWTGPQEAPPGPQ